MLVSMLFKVGQKFWQNAKKHGQGHGDAEMDTTILQKLERDTTLTQIYKL